MSFVLLKKCLSQRRKKKFSENHLNQFETFKVEKRHEVVLAIRLRGEEEDHFHATKRHFNPLVFTV